MTGLLKETACGAGVRLRVLPRTLVRTSLRGQRANLVGWGAIRDSQTLTISSGMN